MAQSKQKIHEGIYLLNERVDSSQVKLMIENKLPKLAIVTLNLEDSVNVTMSQGSKYRVIEVSIHETKELCTLHLGPSHQLRPKFQISFKPLPPGTTQSLMEKDVDKLNRRLVVAKSVFRKIDYNNFDLRLIPSEIGHFLDPSFPPIDTSVNLGTDRPINFPVHWRRPEHFFRGRFDVFMDKIEPNDIKQGRLGDCWFMCALSSLAERPELVRRLFYIEEANAEGFYQIFFCKGGEWVRLTIDDYFPCLPKDRPVFSQSQGNELWVLLIEKAYAKLHGSYALLRGGWASEGMMDLTGCPTLSIDFNSIQGKEQIESDKLWSLILDFDRKGALISASTPGEDRWTETGGPNRAGGLVPGHAYTLIQALEADGNRLVNIRNPWGRFEWEGDWSDTSNLWTPRMRELVNPTLDVNDGTFWMSYADFIKEYSGINICRVDTFFEARIRGRFERKKYGSQEWVQAKGFYIIQSEEPADVIIGVHQDDERIYGVESRRANLDLGIVVLDANEGSYRIFKAKEGERDRQAELEVHIEANKRYIIWPRTTGCALARPPNAAPENISWYKDGEIHPLLESTIKDLFRKANVVVGEDLTFPEFSALMKTANISIGEDQFRKLLDDLPSYQEGLTSEGLIEFFRELFNRYGTETIQGWMEVWGYDRDLYSVKSRNYVLTLHSNKRLKVQMHKVKDTAMNDMVNIMLLQVNSEKKMTKDGVDLHCLIEKGANSFTYGAYNSNPYPVQVNFDCSDNEELVFSGRTPIANCLVPPNSWKVLLHAQLVRGSSRCRLKPALSAKRAS